MSAELRAELRIDLGRKHEREATERYKCWVTIAHRGELPILWQLELSHYNEKVRWALDHKRIAHRRRALLPGLHARTARRLTGDCNTTPVLTLDGVSIGDSTAIIGELEKRWPQPPLYPSDAGERKRALELEEFFDEELGPHVRRAVYQELLPHPELVLPLFADNRPPAARALLRLGFPALRVGMRRMLAINAAEATASRGSSPRSTGSRVSWEPGSTW